VIFLATADEEAGGQQGAGWFAKQHPELFRNAEFLLNEGGGNSADETGKVLAIGVGPSEKTPVWVRLTATGTSGHASIPRADSAVNRLLRALNRLLDYTPPVQLTPVVEQAFKSIAPLRPEPLREKFANIREALKEPDFLKMIEGDPSANALLHNTISITMLEGSNKVNIIPPAAHADIDTRVVPGENLDRWLKEPGSLTAADADVYRGSKMTALGLGHAPASYDDAVRFFADWNGFLAGYSDWFTRVDDASDFARAKGTGKLGVMITFQNSLHFRRPDDVNTFWGLGQRISQLTYNMSNGIGSGFLEQRDGGLTVFGQSIVDRMNEVGMAVDVSHCGDQTTMDAIAASKRPVLFTHANCRALAASLPRLKTDDAIRAMAKSGGVMGVSFIRFIVC